MMTGGYGEDRLSRDRLAELADALDAVSTEAEVGAAVALVATATESAYPSSIAAFYACTVLGLTGTEAEGEPGGTPTQAATIYCFNVGTTIPGVGTKLLAVQVGDRWVICSTG